MYFGSERSIDDTLGQISLGENRLQIWGMLLQNRKDWFERQGIRYLFFIAPDKQSIYPEYLPEPYRKRASAHKRMDQLMDYLKRYTDVPIVDLRPILIDAKRRQPVYYRTDTHWNWYGGWTAYQALMDVIEPWFPDIDRLKDDRIDVAEISFESGDLAARFGSTGTFRETEKAVWVPHPCSKKVQRVFNELSYIKKCPQAGRRVLVLHDSYFNAIEPFLSETFGVSMYLWKKYPEMESYDHEWVRQIIAEYRPDLVIEERAERFLEHNQDFSVPLQFAYGVPAVMCDKDHGFQRIVPYRDVRVEKKTEDLTVKTLGGDPGFLFNTQDLQGRPGVLRIEIQSPSDTTLQGFFKRNPLDGYREEWSRRYPLHGGWNDVLIAVQSQWMGSPIRCDLDHVEEVFHIKKLELRLLSPMNQ